MIVFVRDAPVDTRSVDTWTYRARLRSADDVDPILCHDGGTAPMTSYIRPGFLMTHVANPILGRVGRFPALIVRGRRSGRSLTVPMGEPIDLGGRRYLVSGRGETHWVRNLRAAGRAEFRIHGVTTPFRATEMTGADRVTVVDAYRRKLGHRVDAYFTEIPEADRHPVFRMDPLLEETPAGQQPG